MIFPEHRLDPYGRHLFNVPSHTVPDKIYRVVVMASQYRSEGVAASCGCRAGDFAMANDPKACSHRRQAIRQLEKEGIIVRQ